MRTYKNIFDNLYELDGLKDQFDKFYEVMDELDKLDQLKVG